MTSTVITSRPTMTDAKMLVESVFPEGLDITYDYVNRDGFGNGGFVYIRLADPQGKYVPEWSNKPVPEGFLLTPRNLVEVGDEVVSSHMGARKVTKTHNGGTGAGTTGLWLEGTEYPENYPGDSLIPCKPAKREVTLDAVDSLLADLDAVDRVTRQAIEALDPTHVDLTAARTMLDEIRSHVQTVYASTVKDLGRSDRIQAASRVRATALLRVAADARMRALDFTQDA